MEIPNKLKAFQNYNFTAAAHPSPEGYEIDFQPL